jgi:hypothetical protein
MPYLDLRFELNDPRLRNEIVAGMQLFDNCLVCRQLATGFAGWAQTDLTFMDEASNKTNSVTYGTAFFSATAKSSIS